jgi:hypothetical protein
MTTTTTDDGKLDNMTVRRFAKLLKNNSSNTNTSTPITTGKVVQNDNSLYVAIDNETLVPISDTNSNVRVGDTVTLALDDNKALIVGNITDTNATTSEVKQTNVKVAKAQATAEGAEKVATNYIDIDENKGITVGNMQESTLGHNTYIDANGVSIRDGETVLASFEDDEISLGKNSFDSQVSLCGGAGKICATTDGSLYIYANDVTGSEEFGTSIRLVPQTLIEDDGVSDARVDIAPYKDISLEKTKFISPYFYRGEVEISEDSIKAEVYKEKTESSVTSTEYSSSFRLDKNGFYVCNGASSSSPGYFGLVYGETVLYNNTTGTTSTVTLSESAENFTYLEIYYNAYSTNKVSAPQFFTKVYSPNGKYVSLEGMFRATTSIMQFLQETIQISDTKINRSDTQGWYINATPSTKAVTTGTNSGLSFYIQRVVGIK